MLRGSIRLVRRSSRYMVAPRGPDASLGQTRTRLAKYQELEIAHGFSKRHIVERNTGDPIEDSRLVVLQNYRWNDLAFRLTQRNCGEGIATEVAAAWVHATLDKLGLDPQGALIHPEIAAYNRVLAMGRLRIERHGTRMGLNSILFGLDANAVRTAADRRSA